jgi:hypothetical protein
VGEEVLSRERLTRLATELRRIRRGLIYVIQAAPDPVSLGE